MRLSIDLEITRIVREALERGVELADAQGGRAVVVDPATGEVLAMADIARAPEDAVAFPWLVKNDEDEWVLPEGVSPEVVLEGRDRLRYTVLSPVEHPSGEPSLRRNRTVEEAYEPGSTFKPLVWALAAGRGLLPEDEVIDGHQGVRRLEYGRTVRDVAAKDELTWDEVLVHSSNVGMSQLVERLGEEELRAYVRSMGFGRETGLGLPRESPGIVTSAKNWNHYTQTSIAMGYEVAVTPVQMVRAFSMLARTGERAGTVPDLRLDAAGGSPTVAERVLPPGPVERAREPMRRTAERMDDLRMRFRESAVPATYSMFGKSGTSLIAIVPPAGMGKPRGVGGYFPNQHHTSFLAAAPVDRPRIVVLVVIDDPGPALVRTDRHYGSWTAGPVVREIVEGTLRYLGVAGDLSDTDEDLASAQ
ncbi:MAG: penicillin-binding transpeptidase domain-containing protein [Planctomycetota bacterium]